MSALYVIKSGAGYLVDIAATDEGVRPELISDWMDARQHTLAEAQFVINYLDHYGYKAQGFQVHPRIAHELREATNG
jgi:hypothetical protein